MAIIYITHFKWNLFLPQSKITTKGSVVECLTSFGWIFGKIIASCECDEQNTSWLRISLAPGFSIVIKSCVKYLFQTEDAFQIPISVTLFY